MTGAPSAGESHRRWWASHAEQEAPPGVRDDGQKERLPWWPAVGRGARGVTQRSGSPALILVRRAEHRMRAGAGACSVAGASACRLTHVSLQRPISVGATAVVHISVLCILTCSWRLRMHGERGLQLGEPPRCGTL